MEEKTRVHMRRGRRRGKEGCKDKRKKRDESQKKKKSWGRKKRGTQLGLRKRRIMTRMMITDEDENLCENEARDHPVAD